MIVPDAKVAQWRQTGVRVPLLSANSAKGMHWAQVREAKAPWKTYGIIAGRHLVYQGHQAPEPVIVAMTLPVPNRLRRDPHNFTSTVVKAFIDGLVLSGLLRGDTPDYVHVVDPELAVGEVLTVDFYSAKEWSGPSELPAEVTEWV